MAYTEDVNVNLNVLAGAMGGVTAIMGGMSALTSTFGQFGTEAVDNFGAVDGLLVTTTALLASFGVQAAEAFGEFEQGMKIVQTVSGQSSSAIADLSNKANELSVAYRTSIGDITDGLQTLGRAGLNSANEQIEVLESGLQTAKLEGRNLNGVLEEIIQNTAMLGGDLKSINFGEQAGYLNSLMVGTSMTAPINSHDISQTLQYAGGTAAAAGANLQDKEKLEDLMGTIAAFAQKGVSGSMAGTALRAFFTKPASQDNSVTEGLSRIGLTPEQLWENGGESMKDVSDQIDIIQRQMDKLKLSQMDQIEVWGKIVGPKMGQQMMKLESDQIKDLTRDIQSAQSAEELASETLQTYTQKLSAMQQQGEVAYRELGQKFMVMLSPIVDGLTMVLQLLSDPRVNMAAFMTIMALISHGLRAAWGMITSIGSQIMGLLHNTEAALTNLAGPTDRFTSGMGRSASQIDLLNMKLKETDVALQSIQAKALGIGNVNWVAEGGRIGQKVERGVIASMKQDVFVGGTTKSGLSVGQEGKYYTMTEKSGIMSQAYQTNNANKESIKDFKNARSNLSKSISVLNSDLEKTEAKINSIQKSLSSSTLAKYGTINPNLIKDSNALTGGNAATASGALARLASKRMSLESELKNAPETSEREAKMKDAGVTEQDVKATESLIAEKKRLEAEMEKDRIAYAKHQAEQASKRDTDARGRIIKNREAYVTKAYENAYREGFYDTARAKEHESKIGKIDSQINPKAAQFVGTKETGTRAIIQQEINKLNALEAEIKASMQANLQADLKEYQAQKQKILAMLQQANVSLSTAELGTMLPTASDAELKALSKELQTELHTQIRIVEEEVYQQEMARLRASNSSIDALTYSQNKEIENARLSRIAGTNYRQLLTNSPVPEKDTAAVGMARGTMAKGYAQEMAKTMEAGRQKILSDMSKNNGISGFYQRAQQKGTSILNTYNNALSNAGTRVREFGNQMSQSWQIFRNGIQSVAPQVTPMLMSTAEQFAMSGMTMEAALGELSAATGLTSSQIVALALADEELLGSIIAMVAAEDSEIVAIENVIRAKFAEAVGSQEVASSKLGSVFSSLGSAGSSLVGMMGGPVMAAMMGMMFAMQAYNSALQGWQSQVQEASERMSEAKDKLSTAESNIDDIYKSEFGDISDADLAKIRDYQYAAIQQAYNEDLSKHGKKTPAKFSDMYNNEVIKVQPMEWTDEEKDENHVKTAEELEALNENAEVLTLTDEEHIKQLEDNTAALNSATYAFSQALAGEARAFNDPWFGYQGIQTKMEKSSMFDGALAWLANGPGDVFGSWVQDNMNEKGFYDLNTPVLTEYQKSDDFMGSTEFAPAMMLQIGESGVEGGLKQFFGNDYSETLGLIRTIARRHGQEVDYFSALTNNGFQGMDGNAMSMAQMAMKEDPDSFHVLAKNMFRYEQSRGLRSGHSAMEDWQSGTLKRKVAGPDANRKGYKGAYKDIEKTKWTVQDKNLDASLQKIYRMTDGKLSYANILAMGQLQQMADMYTVANEMIYPSINQTMLAAQQNVLATGYAGSNAGSAAGGAQTAGNNAAIIAGLLGEKFKQDVSGIEYENDYLSDPNGPKSFFGLVNPWIGDTLTKEQFQQGYNDVNNSAFNKYRYHGALTEAQVGDRLNHPDWSQDQLERNAERRVSQVMNSDGSLKEGVYRNWSTVQDTILHPVTNYMEGAIQSAYDQSSLGEYGGNSTGSGGGGGSGGSGGSSGSDKDNTGTKKERVDLVLCNKKEIPKLNVNLFKKPPNFTILNKNFKLRDIKINSQDKPKAIMNAVKNGIIETQKRMDPKIIQDETADYDPLESTDGKSVPSGTTKTTT